MRLRAENQPPASTAPSRARRVLAAAAAALCLAGFSAAPAGAEYTHLHVGEITLASGSKPQPSGVDSQGNIVVFLEDQEVIAKYDTNGNPVDFSALGTNIIDGAGGLECPDVPSDCDRIPAGKIGPLWMDKYMVVVDQSGGPANGYIYLRNNNVLTGTGEIAIFAPTGKYVGTLNESLANPWSDPDVPAGGLSMAPNGTLYVSRQNLQGPSGFPGARLGGGHVDQYAPIDGNPAHNQFVGQLRLQFQYPVQEVNFPPENVIGAGPNGAFVLNSGGDTKLGSWRWYTLKEFQVPIPQHYGLAQDYFPFDKDEDNLKYNYGAVNPNNEWIYLLGGAISIFDQTAHHKVGPTIDGAGAIDGKATTLAFDNSGGPNNGRFYVRGGTNKLSVFGAPVVIPDIEVEKAEQHHYSGTVHATIAPAGGPTVTGCVFEYGLTAKYGLEKPCSPAPPYASDTQVSAELPNLFTETKYHYRVRATNANGYNHTFDNVFRTVAVLDLQTGGVTNLASTSATLNGSLDPDGMPTTYSFQYGLDTKYDLETATQSAGSGVGTIAVDPIDVDKLQPGRTYHYRLVASNALGFTYGDDRTVTAPAKPLISSLNPTNVLADSADLSARINNFDSDAEYYFEYGESPLYGHRTASQPLAASTAAQPVTVHIEGLNRGVTYFFRVVATNGHGTARSTDASFDFSPPACPNSHVRQQVGANYLPDCRAYELVSPVRAGSIQLFPGDFFYRIGPNPVFNEATAPRYENTGYETAPPRFGFFGGVGGLSGVEAPNLIFDRYLSTRTDEGWVTNYAGLKGDETGVSLRGQCSLTQDVCLDYRIDVSDFEQGLRKEPFPYVWAADGAFLGRWPTNYAVVPGADHLTGDEQPSGDFSHYVFSSLDVPFKPGGLDAAPGSVYDNEISSGKISIVSVLNNGDPIPQDAGGPEEYIRIPALSPDASHILMSTMAAGGRANLYMRVNDSVTYDITQGNGVQLLGMSSDGSKVAFVSPSALTSEDTDSSKDIYRWEEETDTVRLISQGNGNGNSDSCNANWSEKCDVHLMATERSDIDDLMAANGDVYFYSPEQLDPENPGVLNQRNLYHLRNGGVQYVATFDPGTSTLRSQISADGQHAAFVTRAMLTGYDNSYYNDNGQLRKAAEMYVFDAGSGEVQCASCNPTGAPPTGLRLDPPGTETGSKSADVLASNGGRFMTDDGRVAFTTAEALSPRDTNGITDVYEYTEGRPQLITAGTGDRDLLPKSVFLYPGQYTGLEGISRDGRDLYFSTFDTLVPQDENGPFVKFYDARTGGGFPVQGKLLPCEAADECHGDASVPAPSPKVGTGIAFSVPGNAHPAPKNAGKKKKRKGRKGRGKRRGKKHNRGNGRRAGR